MESMSRQVNEPFGRTVGRIDSVAGVSPTSPTAASSPHEVEMVESRDIWRPDPLVTVEQSPPAALAASWQCRPGWPSRLMEAVMEAADVDGAVPRGLHSGVGDASTRFHKLGGGETVGAAGSGRGEGGGAVLWEGSRHTGYGAPP